MILFLIFSQSFFYQVFFHLYNFSKRTVNVLFYYFISIYFIIHFSLLFLYILHFFSVLFLYILHFSFYFYIIYIFSSIFIYFTFFFSPQNVEIKFSSSQYFFLPADSTMICHVIFFPLSTFLTANNYDIPAKT